LVHKRYYKRLGGGVFYSKISKVFIQGGNGQPQLFVLFITYCL